MLRWRVIPARSLCGGWTSSEKGLLRGCFRLMLVGFGVVVFVVDGGVVVEIGM